MVVSSVEAQVAPRSLWFGTVPTSPHPVQRHNEVVSMFGLPTATVVVIFGIPAIWVIYTLVFVYLSRGWKAEDVAEDQELTSRNASGGNGPNGPATSANHDRRSGTENGGLA
ncbi:hypothetical protein [Brevibacterium sp. UCMA 11754]|uniref:hypothetical protein n=1 Tax=Brevibacterium sp. UCMA 11754 TaxID=2749198 RepID=UPI001F30871C|nr:hypothetical protein [Brevibacterium sp. UCMA 11754]